MFDFDIDGKALMDMLIEASIKDDQTIRMLKIFKKHNIGAVEAMQLCLEISAIMDKKEKE